MDVDELDLLEIYESTSVCGTDKRLGKSIRQIQSWSKSYYQIQKGQMYRVYRRPSL